MSSDKTPKSSPSSRPVIVPKTGKGEAKNQVPTMRNPPPPPPKKKD